MLHTRSPFQVLVLVADVTNLRAPVYLMLRREPSTGGYWQGVAGGGEGNETPVQAAVRETTEETGFVVPQNLIELKSTVLIPVKETFGSYLWGPEVTEISEHAFGLKVINRKVIDREVIGRQVNDLKVALSDEHDDYRWVSFETALKMLHWESNRAALTELHNLILAN